MKKMEMVNLFPAWDDIHAISFLGFNEWGNLAGPRQGNFRLWRLPNRAQYVVSSITTQWYTDFSILEFQHVATPCLKVVYGVLS